MANLDPTAGAKGRSQRASAEAPIVIENREELIYMLSEAATLEHMVMCQYLFGAFSLKRGVQEGISEEQLGAITRWDRLVSHVAAQEMLHLTIVNNVLTSVGGAPYLNRPNFPQRAKYFPAGVQMVLVPFGDRALRHFLYLERPEGMAMNDAAGFEYHNAAAPITIHDELVPVEQDYATVGHLYRGIETGLRYLSEKYGEKRVFIGPPNAQATREYFGWKELIPVVDLSSALKSIETIVEEGEGARGHWETAHFGKFYHMFKEYHELRKSDPKFEPARPVVPGFVRVPSDVSEYELIKDPISTEVAELFNAGYEILLQLLSRFFIHAQTTHEELKTLSDTAVDIMFNVIRPLGRLLTTLPLDPNQRGKTVGPCFEMYRREYLLPHKQAAWTILHERLVELADYSKDLSKNPFAQSLNLEEVELNLRKQADRLGQHLHSSGV